MKLLIKVLERVEAKNRFDSPQMYVKNIQGPWDGATKYAQAPEYIAEVSAWYLRNIQKLRWDYPKAKMSFALPTEDIQFIEEFFQTMDPYFDRDASFLPRWEIERNTAN